MNASACQTPFKRLPIPTHLILTQSYEDLNFIGEEADV